MKGALSAILIALIIVLIALFFIKKSGPSITPTKLEIVAELPEETSLLCMAPSLETVFKALKVEGNTILSYDISEFIEEMTEELEMNLLSVDDLTKQGIDCTKEIGFFVTDLSELTGATPKGALTVFLPTSEADKFRKMLEKKATEEGATVAKGDGFSLIFEEGDDFNLALAQKGNYLFATGGNDSAIVSDEMKLLLTGKKKLSESAQYKNALDGLEGGGTFFAYADIDKFSNIYGKLLGLYMKGMGSYSPFKMDEDKMASMMKIGKGTAAWLDVNGKDLIIRSKAIMNSEHALTKCFRNNTMSSPIYNISKKPVLVYSQALDFTTYIKEYLKVYSVTDAQVDEAFAEIEKEVGIDLKANLYENLGENAAYAIYDAETINMGTYNMLAAIEIKDPAKATELTKELTAAIKAQFKKMGGMASQMASIDEVTIEGMKATQISFPMAGKLFYGVHGKNLLFSSERALIKEAITGSAKKGFATQMEDETLKKVFSKNSNAIGYLDIDGVAVIINNFKSTIVMATAGFDAEASKKIKTFINDLNTELHRYNYISGYTAFEGEKVTSDFVIDTEFETTFIEGTNTVVTNIRSLMKSM